jgi:16S rRNA (uracil1498-N3)-methyltransferase
VGFASASGAAAHVFAGELADDVVIGGVDGHHLQRVRRLRVGEQVTVADGTGRWRPYTVAAGGSGELRLLGSGAVQREPELWPRLTVAFALSKGTKPEAIVAGLTELGVDRIVPFRSARSVAQWTGDRARAAALRLQRVAREAAMQCRRSRLPVVDEPTDLDGLTTAGSVVVGDPRGVPLDALEPPAGGEWLAVVGAEGGLDARELAALEARPGARFVAIGPHVLRAETAAVAVAAALTTRRVPRDGHCA